MYFIILRQGVYSLEKHGKSEILRDFFIIWKNQEILLELRKFL